MPKAACPKCGARLTAKEVGTLLSGLRTKAARKRAGRKPVLQPCRYCGAEMGTAARRTHEPKCPKKIKES